MGDFFNKVYNWSIKEEYNIGFVENTYADIVSGKSLSFRWMKHKFKDSWFADPFVLDVTENQILLLVEDYYYPLGHGRISLLKVNKSTYVCEERKPLLTLDSHLSFPAIFRNDGQIYVYPESGKSGLLKMYKYQNEELKEYITLADMPFSDAILTGIFGENLCFSTIPTGDSEEETRQQYVYRLDEHLQNFSLIEKYRFAKKHARNAGDFFEIEGKTYRPVQDCSVNYGGGMIIQEVSRDSDGEFFFKEISSFDAKHKNLQLGAHTLNHYKGVTVIDAHGYCNPLLAKMALVLGKIMRK